MITEQVQRLREQWANEWFYYGHDPNLREQPVLEEEMEREIWALWIRNHKFTMKNTIL